LISFDSNVLVYAADAAAGERHEHVADLLGRAMRRQSCIQTLQSFCEFFNVVTRKAGIDAAAAAEFVETWRSAMAVESATFPDLAAAMRGVREHGLSFWDALLWATVRRVGVDLLISEDFQDGRSIEGVRIVNPFATRNARLIEAALSR
jgi:predicted nucleic acid-binding protein